MLPKSAQDGQGFTLVEVLVAMLITSVFFAVALQAVMIAAVLKARAEQHDEAATWIQEDLESVIHQASEYEKHTYPYSLRCNASTSAGGLVAGLLDDIGGTPRTEGPRILAGTEFTLTRTADYATSANPFKLLELTYTVASQSSGYAIATVSSEVIPDAAFQCP